MAKKRVFISFGILLALVIGGWAVGASIDWLRNDNLRSAYEAYVASQASDGVGGKTPQETLDLFVAALRAGDVGLATQYFTVDDRGSRGKWVRYFNDLKVKNLLGVMAEDIATKAKPAGSSYEGSANYKVLNSSGTISLFLQLVSDGQIWKIENL